jgi:hypothetical protein
VYYLKAVPWTVERFSVERHLASLQKLQRKLEWEGALAFSERLMIVRAHKPSPPLNRPQNAPLDTA